MGKNKNIIIIVTVEWSNEKKKVKSSLMTNSRTSKKLKKLQIKTG